ncbi:MBL fold metallo-hydrolase [Diaphorobacter aerolatus]|uniref:MBL fold metallo-hydrolase n=1 Tax=Diaphorobacter aerolatus TaxID=1288495 RepID=A0A7H0GG02_9BURK|nr:MBL fold metallo-hydrolase [Diaphorobacter aerolatus]QNP47218.1 MBL fold metallo-hydrolase [Diaphorobacter aerolatus]
MSVVSVRYSSSRTLAVSLLAAFVAVGCAGSGSNASAPGSDASSPASSAATSGQNAGKAGTPNASAPDAGARRSTAELRAEQTPGFVRMQFDVLRLTALYDGRVDIDAKQLKNASANSIAQLLRQGKQPAKGAVQTSVNAFLLDDGKGNIVLVDTGSADTMGENAGHLHKALAASGYRAEDVTAILLTHLHPDHAGGLLKDGALAFPNAQVYAAKQEADFWLSESIAQAAPEANRVYFAGAVKAVTPYQASGRFHTFTSGKLPIEGFDAVALHGHTPGHTGFMVSSGSEKLLLWGDVVHSHTTQFANPAISLEFDNDLRMARAARIKVLRESARNGQWIAGAHMPFPGVGRVVTQGTGYRWVPLDFAQAMSAAEKRQP